MYGYSSVSLSRCSSPQCCRCFWALERKKRTFQACFAFLDPSVEPSWHFSSFSLQKIFFLRSDCPWEPAQNLCLCSVFNPEMGWGFVLTYKMAKSGWQKWSISAELCVCRTHFFCQHFSRGTSFLIHTTSLAFALAFAFYTCIVAE